MKARKKIIGSVSDDHFFPQHQLLQLCRLTLSNVLATMLPYNILLSSLQDSLEYSIQWEVDEWQLKGECNAEFKIEKRLKTLIPLCVAPTALQSFESHDVSHYLLKYTVNSIRDTSTLEEREKYTTRAWRHYAEQCPLRDSSSAVLYCGDGVIVDKRS